MSLADVEKAAKRIDERWSAVRKATYRVEAVKAAALDRHKLASDSKFRAAASGEKPVDVELPSSQPGRTGVEWGEDMHKLLEAAMRRPDARSGEPGTLARPRARRDEDDEDMGATDFLNRADGAAIGNLEARAGKHARLCREFPSRCWQHPIEAAATAGVQTLRRGAIDLAFFEGERMGDRRLQDRPCGSDSTVKAKVEYYRRPGAKLRRSLGQSLVNEPVIESGLFFTSLDRYMKL